MSHDVICVICIDRPNQIKLTKDGSVLLKEMVRATHKHSNAKLTTNSKSRTLLLYDLFRGSSSYPAC